MPEIPSARCGWVIGYSISSNFDLTFEIKSVKRKDVSFHSDRRTAVSYSGVSHTFFNAL